MKPASLTRLLCALGLVVALAPPAPAATTYTGIHLYPAPNIEVPPPDYPVAAAGQFVARANGTTAVLFNPNGASVSLHPAGFDTSWAITTNGSQQGGFAAIATVNRAFLWSGSAASAIDLHPLAGFNTSFVEGLGGGQQVGQGQNLLDQSRALLWTGTAASAIDLGPGSARGSDGIHQVGTTSYSGSGHAMLWTGTEASAIDLHPLSGINSSLAHAVHGNQQVGHVDSRAHLWAGSAASALDIHPTNLSYVNSVAMATNGSIQVGYGNNPTPPRALLWNGANTAIDLHALLPAGPAFFVSKALHIDADGNIFGLGFNGVSHHAVAWYPTFSSDTSAPDPTPIGVNQTAVAPNPTPAGGTVTAQFTAVLTPGDFSSTYATQTALALATQTSPFTFNPADSADGKLQSWNLNFTGTFAGGITVTFQYDPALLPLNQIESELHVFHLENGIWQDLGGVIDANANTITFTTNSFSPFTLGTPVPEPTTLALLALVPLVPLLARRRRR